MEVIIANQTNLTKVEAVGSVLLLFAVNIIAFYLYDSLAENYIKKSKLALLQKEKELYSRQCEIMQSSTEDLQAFRHDMSNQLIILNHLLEEGKDEEARRQLDQLSRFIKGKVIYSTSGNIIIDGLVNYKLQSVASENIKVETEIVVPKQLNIDIADFVTLLGNLLDNALEALKKVDREQRILTIKIMFSQERLIGRITNTYCGEIYLKDDKILTSKKEKQKHGYGLSNVEKIIKKYNGYEELKSSGTGGNAIMTKGRKTTFEERVEIVQYCIAHNRNYAKTAEQYHVSYQQARSYTVKYETGGVEALRDNHGKRKSPDEMNELEKLRAEVKILKAEKERAEMEASFLKKLDEIERRRG